MDPEQSVETVSGHLLVVELDYHVGGSHHLAVGFG